MFIKTHQLSVSVYAKVLERVWFCPLYYKWYHNCVFFRACRGCSMFLLWEGWKSLKFVHISVTVARRYGFYVWVATVWFFPFPLPTNPADPVDHRHPSILDHVYNYQIRWTKSRKFLLFATWSSHILQTSGTAGSLLCTTKSTCFRDRVVALCMQATHFRHFEWFSLEEKPNSSACTRV